MKLSDFDQIGDDIKKGLVFTKFAYQTSLLEQQDLMDLYQDIKANHQLLLFSDYLGDTKEFYYRCAVFVNHDTKQIVFANAGTRLGFKFEALSDIWSDINLMFGFLPKRFKSIRELNNVVLDSLGTEIANYELVYTGHSLGAAIADAQAADMEIKLLKQAKTAKKISAITFDNPGGKAWRDHLFKGAKLDVSKSNTEHITINNRPNFINTGKAQVGKILELEAAEDQFDFFERGIAKFAKFIKKAIEGFAPECIIKVLDWLSYGSINRQIARHSLDKFVEVLIEGNGKLREKPVEEKAAASNTSYAAKLSLQKKSQKGKNRSINNF